MKDITILIDMSASMKRRATFPAMLEAFQDIKSIILSDEVRDRVIRYRIIKCANNKIEVLEDNKWIPDENECGGVASATKAFDTIISGMKKTNDNLLLCLSDGMLCASPSSVQSFISDYLGFHGTIVEVNVTNNKKALFKGHEVLEVSDLENYRQKIKQIIKK